MIEVLIVVAAATGDATAARPSGVAVVVTRRTGLSPEEGLAIAETLSRRLASAGVLVAFGPREANARLGGHGISDTASCDGEPACALNVAVLLGTPLVVAVEIGALRKSAAIHVEVRESATGALVGEQDIVTGRGGAEPIVVPELPELGAKVRQRLESLASAKVAKKQPADAPVKQEVVVTGPTESAAVRRSAVSAAPGQRRATPATWVAGGVAVAAGGTAIAFAILAGSQRAPVALGATPDGRPFVPVTEDRARQLAADANGSYTASAVATGACAVASGLAAWLYLSSGPGAP
ncbi:MAG: hypothetical protein HYZ28_00935 [Myxococcales bacterium]|nr:hypothetical protein [Myxococcales bacterium]